MINALHVVFCLEKHIYQGSEQRRAQSVTGVVNLRHGVVATGIVDFHGCCQFGVVEEQSLYLLALAHEREWGAILEEVYHAHIGVDIYQLFLPALYLFRRHAHCLKELQLQCPSAIGTLFVRCQVFRASRIVVVAHISVATHAYRVHSLRP